MRIISGYLKGRKIPTVFGIKNVSPSSDFLKEVVFNVIGEDVKGKIFLDLFAGTGNIGFEAMSRGASYCVFVETSPELTALIIKTARQFGIESKVRILKKDVLKGIEKDILEEYRPDYIFADPPYNTGLCGKTLSAIAEKMLAGAYLPASGESNLIIQRDIKETLLQENRPYRLINEKLHGRSALSFYLSE